MLKYFTDERLNNKKHANDSGDRYYRDLEQGQKIIINSSYGLLGAKGLNFNKMSSGSRVATLGRCIIKRGVRYSESLGYMTTNVDTDAFSFVGFDGEFDKFIVDLNSLFRKTIIFEDDGEYQKFIVVKSKNYVTEENGKITMKGSALKATMKEPALRMLLDDVLLSMLDTGYKGISNIYNDCVKEISNIDNIGRWSSKKTVTKAVLNPQRTNEQRVLDAIGSKKVQEGDKVHMFFKTKTELCLAENFDGEYDKDKLYEKAFKTIKIFETILDMDDFLNYKLKKNKERRP